MSEKPKPSGNLGKNSETEKYDHNQPETEEDGIRAEAVRRLKVRQLFKNRQSLTPTSMKPTVDAPIKTLHEVLRSFSPLPLFFTCKHSCAKNCW